jgi:hypothetical protein
MGIVNRRKRALYLRAVFLWIALPFSSALFGQEVPYKTGEWNGDELGNYRAVLKVETKADAVRADIAWRRRDLGPEKKRVMVFDAKSGAQLKNIYVVDINREFGEIIFEPVAGPGDYYVYYMPYKLTGSRNYPAARYSEPEVTADAAWLGRNRLTPIRPSTSDLKKFPEARLIEFQSVDEFSSVYPMEIIATAGETQSLLAKDPQAPFFLFPEDRKYPIRMTDDLPFRWVQTGPRDIFRGEAARGEFYAFQIGVYAGRQAIPNLDVRFSDLKNAEAGVSIPASALRCLNAGGINWNGEPLKKVCSVDKGKVQALWCGIQVPEDSRPGLYEGMVSVVPTGIAERHVKISLKVGSDLFPDAGDSEPGRQSRLRWLDSRIVFDDEVVAPFTTLVVEGSTINCLGRSVTLGPSGFPQRVQSFFAPEVTHLVERGRDVLAGPVKLVVEDAAGGLSSWKGAGLKFTKQKPGAVAWESRNVSDALVMDCRAQMEMDGFIEFKVRLTAAKPLDVKDIRLEIPMVKDATRYMMGLGFKGGVRPTEFQWAWDQKKNQDALWIGDVNAGVQCSLRAESYSRPLNTNFYLSKPLNMPPSWFNEGKGGCRVKEAGSGVVLFTAYSGPRPLKPGEELHFDFNFLLTPFKTIDTNAQWSTRFIHAYKTLEEVARTGANTINIHHANDINPYINYPFLRPKEMKAYIDEAHRRGFKVKIYNTIRELSNRAAELFGLRSLGSEIFSRGPGGGYSWLQEHVGSDYIAAWFVPQLKDAAIINSGMSRWHNYYLEGLNWLAKNVGIDGLYIDDVAFDRTTMKRVRKILDRTRPGSLIDLHSANQFNPRDGFASSANLYLEHFPYINRLWFGEYFDYFNSPPDYWLIEVSGIPFGLMGEMLQDGGNPWRGMIYGMTNRLPWSGNNPARLWKAWDDFGMQDSRMIGYWVDSCPIKTDHKDVLATAYVKKGKVLISLASWAKGPVMSRLKIDWKTLGLDPAKAKLRASGIPDFQFETEFAPDDPIPFEPGKGWLLILE